MTVTGAVTAVLQPTGVYVPPFQRASAQIPLIRTTGTPSPTGGANPNINPPIYPSGPGAAAYAAAYLQAHMLSIPSYRYAIVLWCVLGVISIAYAVAHHIRLSGGSVGAAYTKWGMRRVTIFGRPLASNSLLVTMALVGAVAIVLSVAGNDYIAPSSSFWDFSSSMARRAVNSATAPKWTISKSLWTAGSRMGVTAFALLPLVVLLALKAPPFALFSLPFFTALYSDQLIFFHRAAGWLIYALTTAHVVLWTVQLFQDQYNGKAVWFAAFSSIRFIFGCVAYGCMSLLMVLSLRPVRKNQFEFFYIAHLVLVVATLITSALHHPVLWYWIAIAGGLWVGDRVWRLIRFARLNAGGGKSSVGNVVGREKQLPALPGNDIDLEEFSDKMIQVDNHDSYQTIPIVNQAPQTPPRAVSKGYPPAASYGYADGEIQPLGTYDNSHGYDNEGSNLLPHVRQVSSQPSMGNTAYNEPYSPTSPACATPQSRSGILAELGTPPDIPVGYAQAQLLPSRTVRLTIRMPRPLKYAPGQSILLTLPDLSNLQSHPFTICNNDPKELVLLVKARRGLTRKLYDLVRRRAENTMSANSKRGAVVPLAAPVYVRARVDGPMGSSGRVRWNDFATVLIICGGSGVSFGLSVCEHLCNVMRNSGPFESRSDSKTRRVRFVWIVREYAEIGWAASALCRARQMAHFDANQLQIDIYVTNGAPKPKEARYDDLAPPRPIYSRQGPMPRISSFESVTSDMSGYSDSGEMQYDSFEAEMENAGAQAIDLSLYEGDEDVDDPAEAALSYQVRKDGKALRARSRLFNDRSESPGYAASFASEQQPQSLYSYNSYPPTPTPARTHADLGLGRPSVDSMGHGNPYAVQDAGRPSYDSVAPVQNSGVFQRHEPRPSLSNTPSQHTLDNTGYGDSYLSVPPPGQHPRQHDQYRTSLHAPSAVQLDEPNSAIAMRNAVAVMSRTQSMVLLQTPGAAASSPSSGLWIDEADYAAMSILSEMARSGRPKLGAIFDEEVERSAGAMLVATCGPTKLNTVVRNLVSRNIHPGKILRGDKRGHIAIISEDFEN